MPAPRGSPRPAAWSARLSTSTPASGLDRRTARTLRPSLTPSRAARSSRPTIRSPPSPARMGRARRSAATLSCGPARPSATARPPGRPWARQATNRLAPVTDSRPSVSQVRLVCGSRCSSSGRWTTPIARSQSFAPSSNCRPCRGRAGHGRRSSPAAATESRGRCTRRASFRRSCTAEFADLDPIVRAQRLGHGLSLLGQDQITPPIAGAGEQRPHRPSHHRLPRERHQRLHLDSEMRGERVEAGTLPGKHDRGNAHPSSQDVIGRPRAARSLAWA